MKVGLKWKCKVGIYIVTYCVKWLLTKHFKKMHGLVVEKVKHAKLSTFEIGLWRQDNVKMNTYILGNAMAVQRWNDQKVAHNTHAKAQRKCNKLVIIVEQCPPLPKPTLVKLISKQMLQVLGCNVWGMGNVLRNATSRMEKDENLQEMIRTTRFTYAWWLKMAWDVKNWDRKSIKASWTEELTNVLKIIKNNNQCLLSSYNFVSSKVC